MTTENPKLNRKEEELSFRTVATHRDTDTHGDIRGGWILDVMDIAASGRARFYLKRDITPMAVSMSYFNAITLGDEVSCFTDIVRSGAMTLRVKVEVWVRKSKSSAVEKVAEGLFSYAGLSENRQRVPIDVQLQST